MEMHRMAAPVSCHPGASGNGGATRNRKNLVFALAGNANVGKSVIFNQLTGAHQTIGNWPGKTVERAEGVLHFRGREFSIVDLPGIYSLSTFSLEEVVSREYIAREKPDVIINVVGAPVLERNLFFTLQLLEMDVPLVICLNQMDIAGGKGLSVDSYKLSSLLGVPVIPTVASRGEGVPELIERAIEISGHERLVRSTPRVFDGKLESAIEELTQLMEAQGLKTDFAFRWVAIKLIEEDAGIRDFIAEMSPIVSQRARAIVKELDAHHEQPAYLMIAAERYAAINRIVTEVQQETETKASFATWLDRLTTHQVFGYAMSLIVTGGLLLWTFTAGNWLSGLLTSLFSFFHPVTPTINGSLWVVILNGLFGGLVAGITLVIPYVVPFYLMLAALEDSGILTRVAFMLDSVMHKVGLHGKAIIPLILGYGCNVPAIYATRIMGTRRERLLASFAVTFAPCTARTIIVLGLVAAFLGTTWAIALYIFDLAIMVLAVKLASKALPGQVTGLIMEMHAFKIPSLSVITKQTWARTKSLIYMVFPLYLIGSAGVQALYVLGILQPVSNVLSFLTVDWLKLPVIAGILLLFGIVRKELILLTLVAIYGANLTAVLSPSQLIVLALVGILYLPCLATISILAKEFGWKVSAIISAANLASALVIGGIMARLLPLIT